MAYARRPREPEYVLEEKDPDKSKRLEMKLTDAVFP
jgi:hypothetical protein